MTNDQNLRLGKYNHAGDYQCPFNGVIDEVRISDGKTKVSVSGNQYMHGKHSWKVEGPSSGEAVISQLLSSDVVEYLRRKPGVCFSFCYRPDGYYSNGEKNKARAEIQYYDGSWHTIYNDTAKPVNEKWIMTQANGKLPATATQVKVLIRGYAYNGQVFKAWIDNALLNAYYNDLDNSNPLWGRISLVTSIYHSAAIPNLEYDGLISGAIAISVNATSPHHVYSLEVKTELLPNDGSSTTQSGAIFILYSEGSNSENKRVEPGAVEIESNAIATGLLAVKTLLFLGGTVCALPFFGTGGIVAGWAIRTVSGAFLTYDVYRAYQSATSPYFDHDCAAGGQFDYFTQDYWKYYNVDIDIDWITAHSLFDWRFKTNSDEVFAIRITATVKVGEYIWDPESLQWVWVGIHTLSVQRVLSIANYWN